MYCFVDVNNLRHVFDNNNLCTRPRSLQLGNTDSSQVGRHVIVYLAEHELLDVHTSVD